MTLKPVGLLVDTYYDNTGDKAIRLAMEDFLRDAGILYEVMNPHSFDRSLYSHIVIGGGHLIRDPDGGYYDRFRVPGPHILNTVGMTASRELEYLAEYALVSVRSNADRERLKAAVPELDVSVVPCVSITLRSEEVDYTLDQPTIGLQISPGALEVSRGIDKLLSETAEHSTLFIPFMHYSGDHDTMEPLASAVPGAAIAPYLQPRQVFSLISQLRAFISCSLHGSIFAYANNVPFLGFDSEGTAKIREFMTDRGLEKWLFRDIDDLRQKLPELLAQRPDYSELLAKDSALVEEHFRRIASILKQSVPAGSTPLDVNTGVTSSLQRVQSGVADRDMELARLRNVYTGTVRKLTHEVTRRDHDIARQQDALAQQQSTLTDRDATIARQAKLIKRKDRHIEELEASLHAANVHLGAYQHELTLIRNSLGYRLLEMARTPVRRLAPEGTRRRLLVTAVTRGTKIIVTRGPHVLLARLPQYKEWLPRLQGASLPPAHAGLDDQYQVWLARHSLLGRDLRRMREAAARLDYRPLVSIVMPVFNPELSWLQEAIDSVGSQVYDNWELCIADDGSTRPGVRDILEHATETDSRIKATYLEKNQGISAASNAALALASGTFVGMLDHDDELKPDALFQVVSLLNEQRDLDFIYSDEDKKDDDGRLVEPFFKPDWSPDLLMSVNYVTHFAVARKSLVDELGGFRLGFEGSQDYDLALRLTEQTDRIAHISRPLYTWRKFPGSTAAEEYVKKYANRAAKKALRDALKRRGQEGQVVNGLWKGRYRVKYEIEGSPKVAIVIPTRDRLELVQRCIDSIRKKSTYQHFEIIIVDNGSEKADILAYLASFEGKVVRHPGDFNFSRLVNLGAGAADGCDAILLLNNDTEVIAPDWIEAMLEHCQRPQVAAVGARLLYPDGRAQHEGIIMGFGGGCAGNVDHGGYFALGQVVRNFSAVTAACVMIKPSVFRELGGFDEELAVAFNDVDFCLRAVQRGYRIVYTPYALLYHHEGGSRGRLHPEHDEQLFRSRWGKPGHYRDPYYNDNLNLMAPFTLRV